MPKNLEYNFFFVFRFVFFFIGRFASFLIKSGMKRGRRDSLVVAKKCSCEYSLTGKYGANVPFLIIHVSRKIPCAHLRAHTQMHARA